MDEKELLNELDEFLNEKGLYQSFLDWAEQKGFDRDELEFDIEILVNT